MSDERDRLQPPENGVLTRRDASDMAASLGHHIRYRIVEYLLEHESASYQELEETVADGKQIHHHVNRLVDDRLVQRRKRRERDSDGLYSYYTVTSFGRLLMEDGFNALFEAERNVADQYGTPPGESADDPEPEETTTSDSESDSTEGIDPEAMVEDLATVTRTLEDLTESVAEEIDAENPDANESSASDAKI